MANRKITIADDIIYGYDDDTSVHAKLFKTIGLYQLLQPFTGSGYDTISFWYRKAMLAVVWLIATLNCMQIIRLYLAIDDIQLFPYAFMMTVIGLTLAFKGYQLVTNTDRLWAILDVARYGYTSCGVRDPSRLQLCRNTLINWQRVTTATTVGTLIVWIVTPFLSEERVPFVQLDGTIGYYQSSVYNMWLPVPESVYNQPAVWALIYGSETFVAIAFVFCWLLFDSYTVTVLITLNAQFDTVSASCAELGMECIKLDYYDDLILHIIDNKKTIEKYDELFDVIRPLILVQILISSFSMITFVYCIILGYLMGLSIFSAPILKYFTAYATFALHLFIYCYVLTNLETAKSKMNFGLYSCNWTEMDLKFKKTLLLAMNMNSAHMRRMKISPKSIINLEMFAIVITMSFKVVPILLNINVEK